MRRCFRERSRQYHHPESSRVTAVNIDHADDASSHNKITNKVSQMI